MKPRYLFTMMCVVFFCVISCGSDDSMLDSEAQSENQQEVIFDAYATAAKFWGTSIYENEENFIAFTDEIAQLDYEKTELLVQAIDQIFVEKNHDYYSSYDGIPVYWDSWPAGRFPNSVSVTTRCGGDYDVSCRYDNVNNAYSKPWNIWFETNHAIVYGLVKVFHNGKVLAFDITSSNQVNICVGVGINCSYWYVKALSLYFWGGLAINS